MDLRIFVQHKNISKVDFAMESLKHAMKWDEVGFCALLACTSAVCLCLHTSLTSPLHRITSHCKYVVTSWTAAQDV